MYTCDIVIYCMHSIVPLLLYIQNAAARMQEQKITNPEIVIRDYVTQQKNPKSKAKNIFQKLNIILS